MTTQLEQAWELAKQRFAAVGIDVEEALVYPFQCTAGRAMMFPVLKTRKVR
ncbi:L-rhamnose isomerase [Escherichia coli]|nr:L-rhamnose isomerase [Escherichia coli]EHY3479761.1 L-rhamnose isomerase [Escherichia coli]